MSFDYNKDGQRVANFKCLKGKLRGQTSIPCKSQSVVENMPFCDISSADILTHNEIERSSNLPKEDLNNQSIGNFCFPMKSMLLSFALVIKM